MLYWSIYVQQTQFEWYAIDGWRILLSIGVSIVGKGILITSLFLSEVPKWIWLRCVYHNLWSDQSDRVRQAENTGRYIGLKQKVATTKPEVLTVKPFLPLHHDTKIGKWIHHVLVLDTIHFPIDRIEHLLKKSQSTIYLSHPHKWL